MDDLIRFGFQCPNNGLSIGGEYDPESRRLALTVNPLDGDDPAIIEDATAFTERAVRAVNGQSLPWSGVRQSLLNRGVHPSDL